MPPGSKAPASTGSHKSGKQENKKTRRWLVRGRSCRSGAGCNSENECDQKWRASVPQQRCSVSKDGGGIFEEAVEQDEEITEAGGEGDHGQLAPGAELLVGRAGLHLGAEQTDECGSPLPLGSGDSNREGRRRSKPVPSPKAAEDRRTPRPRGIRPPHEKSRSVFGVRREAMAPRRFRRTEQPGDPEAHPAFVAQVFQPAVLPSCTRLGVHKSDVSAVPQRRRIANPRHGQSAPPLPPCPPLPITSLPQPSLVSAGARS